MLVPRAFVAAALAFVAVVPGAVWAGEVFGFVTVNGKPAAGETLTVTRPGEQALLVRVRLGANGDYSVFLAPGRYEARLSPGGSLVLVHSFPARVRQDLQFSR